MADEIVYKKVTRKADKGLEGKIIAKHGKQTNQKLKPYVVLEYLMKYSDANNTKSAYDIIGYLEGCGISAERRSIYKDIEDINRIMLMLQEDIDLDEVDMMIAEAEESGDEEEINDLKPVLYDKNKKGLTSWFLPLKIYLLNDLKFSSIQAFQKPLLAHFKIYQKVRK